MDYESNYTTVDPATAGTLGAGTTIFYLVLLAYSILVMWKVFQKAGQPGWAAIVPIYNIYILLKIVGRPAWWLVVILLVPVVNLVLSLLVSIDLAKSFGKSPVFGVVGLFFFSVVGFSILAFGSSKYSGPSVSSGTGTPAPVGPAPAAPAA